MSSPDALVGVDQAPGPAVADLAVVDEVVVVLGVRVRVGLLLADPLVDGLAVLLLPGRVAVALAGGVLLGRGVAAVQLVGDVAVPEVLDVAGLVLVVDAVVAVDLLVTVRVAHVSTLLVEPETACAHLAPSVARPANGGAMDADFTTLDRWWRAANYLSVGQIYLMDNPLLREPLRAGARQAAAARPLGHDAGPDLHLRPPQPGDHGARPGDDLHHRPRPRRPGRGGRVVPRGHLLRGLPRRRPRRARPAPAVHAVLLPRRHPEPRRAGDARLDPRGRRARLRALARVRRRVRQPRPRGRGGGRRRRGGDRAAGDQLALARSSSTRAATARCCRSCTSTATRSPTRRCWPGSPRTSCSR